MISKSIIKYQRVLYYIINIQADYTKNRNEIIFVFHSKLIKIFNIIKYVPFMFTANLENKLVTPFQNLFNN